LNVNAADAAKFRLNSLIGVSYNIYNNNNKRLLSY